MLIRTTADLKRIMTRKSYKDVFGKLITEYTFDGLDVKIEMSERRRMQDKSKTYKITSKNGKKYFASYADSIEYILSRKHIF